MPNFSHRSLQKEMMDGETNPAILEQNYNEIAKVNKVLGGYATLLNGVGKLIDKQKVNVVLDIGCGAGDNIATLLKWANKHKITLHVIGLDYNATACQMARKSFLGLTNVEIVEMDYRNYKPKMKIDVVCTSLFNHHLTDAENIELLQWSANNSEKGFVINDLHRHPIAYYFIKWVAVLVNTSIYFRNDAPLSVLRSFKRKELDVLAQRAKVKVKIQWKWAFRWLILHQK